MGVVAVVFKGDAEMGGSLIEWNNGAYRVPEEPVVPFIEGDGIGPDIWRAAVRVFDRAVERASGGERKVHWLEILAGQKAHEQTGEWLPQATLDAIQKHCIAIKGPLTTPVGGGIRSIPVRRSVSSARTG